MNPVHPRLAAGLAVSLAGATLALTPTASQAVTHAAEEKPQEAPAASVADDGLAPVRGTSADDRYIVVLDKEAPGKSLRSAKAEVRADGATVTHTYSTVLDGFAAELNDKALAALRKNPNVAYIEADAAGSARRDPVAGDLGPGPHRPARPAAEQLLHLQRHRRGRDGVRHRHRHPDHPHPVRRPRGLRLHRHQRRPRHHRLQRPRHARRRHRRRHDVRRGQGRTPRGRPRPRLRRQRLQLRRHRRRRLGHAATTPPARPRSPT